MKTFIFITLCCALSLSYSSKAEQAFNDLNLKYEINTDHIQINLPDGVLKFKLSDRYKNASSQHMHLHQGSSQLTATIGKNSVFGKLNHNGQNYQLSTTKNGLRAINLSSGNYQINSCGTEHSNQAESFETLIHSGKGGEPVVIDVYFLYSQSIAERYPGDLLDTRLEQYVNVANQSLANSGINLGIRNVGKELKTYSLSENNVDLRNHMQRSLSGETITGLGNLASTQNQVGADIFVYIRPHDIQTRGNCGVAFFPETNQVRNTLDPTFGVHVMSDGVSSWSVCSDQLFIHELGHNLGAGHHNVSAQFQYLPGAAGFARLGAVSTIMGSFGTGRPERFMEVDMFSNPSLNCAGSACGTSGSFDNTSTINQIMTGVANYSPNRSNAPFTPITARANPDSDGDGVSDWDDFLPFNHDEQQDSDLDGVGDNSDEFPFNNSELSDFDQDGTGDNADPDDDNDTINDFADTFPFDPNESQDRDQDGVGDNSDPYPSESTEFSDFDQDNIADNQDEDDDNDTFIDIQTGQDILVINSGNNTILRLDSKTGVSKGFELNSENDLLTFQSDLAIDKSTQTLYFTSSSSVKSLDLMKRKKDTFHIPPYENGSNIQLGTGFPTSIEFFNDERLLLASRLQNPSFLGFTGTKKAYNRSGINLDNSFFDNRNFNIVDQATSENASYLLDFNKFIYKISHPVLSNNATEVKVGNQSFFNWLEKPYAMIAGIEDQLYISDLGHNKVFKLDPNSQTVDQDFINLASLNYSSPTGLAITEENILLVAAHDQNAILKFDPNSGEFLGELVSGNGLEQPNRMILTNQLNDRFHNDAEKVLRPNGGLWFNPEKSGRGFDIHVFNNRLAVIVYTYDENGSPIWYLSSGELDDFNYSGDLLKFAQNPGESLSNQNVGQVSVQFSSEKQANIQWSVDEAEITEAISWLSFNNNPQQHNYTGLWGREDGPGWGVTLTTIGSTTVAVPYFYDASGQPRWLISEALDQQETLNFNLIATQSTTLCPSCTGEANVTSTPAGTMTVQIGSESKWSSDIDLPTPLEGTWNLDQVDIQLFSSEPTRPR